MEVKALALEHGTGGSPPSSRLDTSFLHQGRLEGGPSKEVEQSP